MAQECDRQNTSDRVANQSEEKEASEVGDQPLRSAKIQLMAQDHSF
jgi:hypothetical protein